MAHHETDIAHDGHRLAEGLLFLLLYCLLIAAAVHLTANVGADCAERGPCKVWLGPGVASTSVAYAIGLLFVVRDFIRRRIGVAISLCAVVMGATLSGVLIMQGFVLATTVALLLILLAIPFTRWLFKRDRRIGLEPA